MSGRHVMLSVVVQWEPLPILRRPDIVRKIFDEDPEKRWEVNGNSRAQNRAITRIKIERTRRRTKASHTAARDCFQTCARISKIFKR